SHLGLPEGFASFLLLGLLALGLVLVYRMVTARRATAAASYSGSGAGVGGRVIDAAPARIEPQLVPAAAKVAKPLPPGFDATGFLREAMLQFRRLQAAWDAGDRKAFRNVMTSAMADEMARELDQRGSHEATEVISLNAEMLEVTTEAGMHWGSVRF